MKLTRLELSGFKSFADSVTLNFEEGVTSIVGPNGCGKSNISDAVRWVLGEQSARLLRGGKMEDVIFQGSTGRRQINLAEVSLYLDNSAGELPTPYTEVVITRRLSRSGQSDYLLNGSVVRRRDLQDLLHGTGLSGDAGVVIEARMIDVLLSDRADERRSLFEEAAGVAMYRDRRHTTARRLEETAGDLQRLDDLIAEVQSQVRSLARQKGKAERHVALTREKFSVAISLAQLQLEQLNQESSELEQRFAELHQAVPAARAETLSLEASRETAAQQRQQAELHRATITEELTQSRVQLEKLEGDLAVSEERLANAILRRQRAAEERGDSEIRLQQARLELQTAQEEQQLAREEHDRVTRELSSRTAAEETAREKLSRQRELVRRAEQELQHAAQQLRSLEGERTALETELHSLRERLANESSHHAQLAQEVESVQEKLAQATHQAAEQEEAGRRGAAAAEQARLLLRETRERESREVARRRSLQEDLARLEARRSALEALERDRVGLAPAAAALLGAREKFADQVVGPVADFISTEGSQAELAEQLLGEFAHAVLVSNQAGISEIQQWHSETQPGNLILLPLDPGPTQVGGPIDSRLTVDPVAVSWVSALIGNTELLDQSGRALRQANGVIYLSGPSSSTGPIRRRAELRSLAREINRATDALEAAEALQRATSAELEALELSASESRQEAERLAQTARQAAGSVQDLTRRLSMLNRELQEAEQRSTRSQARIQHADGRLAEITAEFAAGSQARGDLEQHLAEGRALLTSLETAQEQARDHRSQWQVQEAHTAARIKVASETITRSERLIQEAVTAGSARGDEIATLEADTVGLQHRIAEWQEQRGILAERRTALETAVSQASEALRQAGISLGAIEEELSRIRRQTEQLSQEHHQTELTLADTTARKARVRERVEAEWKRPLEVLIQGAALLELDLDTLAGELQRITDALDQIGPVNALAVEEHAEESKRATFLLTQRDDLVAARQSLLQAMREIDSTAKALFLETFEEVRGNFQRVFQTLFGGGECDVRLADPDDPLESEIEIHAAPRGKRTQRIHLLSSGERTLVAVSLLFSIYLTRPSPFCLMDEVDAPLDDANVGRFLRLLEEFKSQTQFLVITHNPRTMQAADSVYGVTMQEPGVSTIIGVRLNQEAGAA